MPHAPPSLVLALALLAAAAAPLSARLPEAAPAPPFAHIAERARALQGDGAAQARAELDAYAAELRGGRVAGWTAWVIRTFKEGGGASHGVYLAAEDPYAPLPAVRRPPPGSRGRRYSAQDRPAYLILTGLPRDPALRPGQQLSVDGTLGAARLGDGIELTIERARFTTAPEPALPAAARGDVRDLQISLERGACFGSCPVYKIAAAGSLLGEGGGGTITWTGRASVGVVGTQRAPIDAARLRQLYAALLRADFLHLRDRYENHIVTDGSTSVLTMRRGREQKTVRYYHGDHSAPTRLAILEGQIDALLGAADWIEAAR